MRETLVLVDIVKLMPTEEIFLHKVPLPYSLILSKFGAPVHAINYSLRINEECIYSLEGKLCCIYDKLGPIHHVI